MELRSAPLPFVGGGDAFETAAGGGGGAEGGAGADGTREEAGDSEETLFPNEENC